MSKPPSRTAIRRALNELDKSVEQLSPIVSEPLAKAPEVRGISIPDAIQGLKSGQYVLLNRPLLRHIIKELSK